MMNSADRTTLRRALRSLSVQLPYHTVMQPVSMLSIEDTLLSVEVSEDDWVHAKRLQSPQEEEAFTGPL